MRKIKSIDVATAHKWLENKEAIVIDVREPYEYEEAHIAGSYLIPLSIITKSNLPKIAHDKKIIMICKIGMRSSIACEKILLEDLNLSIYNLEGGIIDWERSGYPTVK